MRTPAPCSRLVGGALAAAALLWSPLAPAEAQQVNMRLHTFVPAVSSTFKNLTWWAETVKEKSGDRINIAMFASMQLGGRPSDLYNQAKDGVVDISWTLPGYTAGLFPRLEVFELPFVATTSIATSQAVMEFYDKWLVDELKEVHPVVIHAPGSPVLHVRGRPIRTLEDFQGRRIRTPSRPVGDMLQALGAVAVPIPGAGSAEELTRGVVEAAPYPFAIAMASRIIDAVDSHTIAYTHQSILMMVMNRRSYERLPAELKEVIDEHSRMWLARAFAERWTQNEVPGRAHAEKLGHDIYEVPDEERQRWIKQAEPVIAAWVEKMTAAGHPGQQMVDDARALIAKYSE